MTTSTAARKKQDLAARVQEAAAVAVARAAHAQSPRGQWQDGLWYPDPEEQRACCETIHPNPANRQALESHCRTQTHVAQLFDVPLVDLKRAVRALRHGPEGETAAGRASGAVESKAAVLCEVSRGARSEALQELREAAGRLGPLLGPLLAAEETGEEDDLSSVLEDLAPALEEVRLRLDYYHRLQATLRAAQAAREAFLSLQGKSSQGAGDDTSWKLDARLHKGGF